MPAWTKISSSAAFGALVANFGGSGASKIPAAQCTALLKTSSTTTNH